VELMNDVTVYLKELWLYIAITASIRVRRTDEGAWRGVQVGSAEGFFGPFSSGMAGCRGRGARRCFSGDSVCWEWVVSLLCLFLPATPNERSKGLARWLNGLFLKREHAQWGLEVKMLRSRSRCSRKSM
jgi:hypothetical protein